MLITEFRITLPLTVEEYQVGQLHAVAEHSKAETGGGDGVEVKKNEPFTNHPEFGNGQYTEKIYHLQHKVPAWVRKIAPTGSLQMREEAWNAYPYCMTKLTNPGYMKEAFTLNIISWHKPDRGNIENVHNLSPEKLAKREIVKIDIANDQVRSSDYKPEFDPRKYTHERGPLSGNWQETCEPVMTCYKLVECEFVWRLFGSRIENLIMDVEKRLFTSFQRQVFCTHYLWKDLTMEDIRAIEEKTRQELDDQRENAEIKGTTEKSY